MKKIFFSPLIALFLLASPCAWAEDSENSRCEGGMVFNSQTGRCLTEKGVQDDKDQYLACSAMSEQSARNDCLLRLAAEQTSEINLSKPHDRATRSQNISATFLTLNALNFFLNSDGFKKSGCNSILLGGATALVGIGAEAWFKNKSKKIQTDLTTAFGQSAQEDPFETQLNAFRYLLQEQKELESLSKRRSTVYGLMTIGYVGQSVMAGLELSAPVVSGCSTWESGLSLGTGIFASGLTIYLTKSSSDQASEAKSNQGKIQAIIDQLTNSLADSCPDGHEDLNNKNCYCYLASGVENTKNSHSETCQNMWSETKRNLHVDGSDLDGKDRTTGATGCVSISNQFDPNCKCRSYKDAKGQNACKKTLMGNMNLNGLSPFGIGGHIDTTNDLFSGNTSFGALNSDSIDKQAIKSSQLREQVLSQLNKKLAKQERPQLKADKLKTLAMNEMKKNKSFNDALASSNQTFTGLAAQGLSPSLQAAVDKAKQEMDSSQAGGKIALTAEVKKKKNPFDYFNAESSPSAQDALHVPGAEQSEVSFNNDDINTRRDVSIWKILNSRYIQTGLQRLNEEE